MCNQVEISLCFPFHFLNYEKKVNLIFGYSLERLQAHFFSKVQAALQSGAKPQ